MGPSKIANDGEKGPKETRSLEGSSRQLWYVYNSSQEWHQDREGISKERK
jgi:hypothetical protein